MESIFTGIDHPVIGIRNMEEAKATYEKLGFTMPPRGLHAAWGTGNWCIMFETDYLELRGAVDPIKGAQKMKPFFDKHEEGMMGVALATKDAEACHDELVNRGFHPQPVRQLTRDFELPEGTLQPKFSLCFLDQEETAGLMSVVACQHMTPELLRRPEWLQHENGALGVKSMTGIVSDVDATAEAHANLFGNNSVGRDHVAVNIKIGADQAIRLTTPDRLPELHPGLDFLPTGPMPRLLVVTLRVASLTATKECLSAYADQWIERSGAVMLHPQAACGVVLEFEEH